MKKIKKIIVIGLVFLMCFSLFCGCNKNNDNKGDFYVISEVYESNEITRQDLLSIVYYIYGMVIDDNKDEYPEVFVPTPKDPEKLDENTERAIGYTYKYQLKKADEKLYSDVIIKEVRYYGTYNDYICVGIKTEIPGVDYGDEVFQETIDGVSYWQTPNFKVLFYKI